MLQQRYRRDYDGEFVIMETVIANGQKSQTREWIANPIENQHMSGRAACIVSNFDINRFKYSRLERHRGGLRGSKRLQTYGTGTIWQDMRLDFYASTNGEQLESMSKTDYGDTTVAYSSANECLRYPGKFYIVPYAPRLCDMVLPVYLAAFDGHQEVFLLGFSKELATDQPWVDDLDLVIKTYNTTKFFFVGYMPGLPDVLRYNINLQHMDYRSWVCHCDV